MNELEMLKSQLSAINTKRVKIQTIAEQAKKQCDEIQQKYNVQSEEELKELVEKAEEEYQKSLLDAQQYITNTNQILSSYNGVI